MGVAFKEGKMVHLLIRNLPSDGVWPHFRQLLTQCAQDYLDRSANLVPPPPPDTLLNIIITHISIECNHLESSRLEAHCRQQSVSLPAPDVILSSMIHSHFHSNQYPQALQEPSWHSVFQLPPHLS